MNTRGWVGNDIVDLSEPGVAGKERDRRFMERVFTPEERARILEAAAPTIALWKTWAAKEAAFKVASKLRSQLVFRHQAFEVLSAPAKDRLTEPATGADESQVRFEDLLIRVRWDAAREYIHCVAQVAGSRWGLLKSVAADEEGLSGLLTEAERESVYSRASARARLLAQRLARQWDLHRVEVLRRWESWGWSAPVLVAAGQRLPAFDVSLSHDGRYVAAALSGPTG